MPYRERGIARLGTITKRSKEKETWVDNGFLKVIYWLIRVDIFEVHHLSSECEREPYPGELVAALKEEGQVYLQGFKGLYLYF